MAGNRIVRSLWIGDRLGTMERLAIASFLEHGHEFHLYTYGHVDGVPPGTVLRDGNDELPESEVFAYGSGFGEGSYSGFSNLFRYHMLHRHGGWWVDMDVVCLRPFDFPEDAVLATEQLARDSDQFVVSTAVIKQPRRSRLMEWACRESRRIPSESLKWGDAGPRLLQRGVDTLNLDGDLRPYTIFCPVAHFDWRAFIDPDPPEFSAAACAAHLWHQMWLHEKVDPDGEFPASSLYEVWKKRLLG